MTTTLDFTTFHPQISTMVPEKLPAIAATGPRREAPLPARIQASYTARFVASAVAQHPQDFHLIAGGDLTPAPGDVVIARISHISNHKRVETPASRKAVLFDGALVMLAYGHRYAADQFLAHVPDNLDHCHLVAAGGIAGVVTELHDRMEEPTEIEPLGLLATTDGGVVNVRDFAAFDNPLAVAATKQRPKVIAVLGTSMNSGKSTTLACLVNGLTAAGQQVAAGKITGTGAGNDRMLYHDAGAHRVVDFTDFGYPTTFKMNFAEIRALTVNMINTLSAGSDTVIVEIADGIYQGETARLLRDELFQECVDSVVFSAVDALGAKAGAEELIKAGLKVSAAAGVMTASPLATAEAAAVLESLGVPVISTFALTEPEVATGVAEF